MRGPARVRRRDVSVMTECQAGTQRDGVRSDARAKSTRLGQRCIKSGMWTGTSSHHARTLDHRRPAFVITMHVPREATTKRPVLPVCPKPPVNVSGYVVRLIRCCMCALSVRDAPGE